MLDGTEAFRQPRDLLHWTKYNRIGLLAGQADHMMMMVILLTMEPELDAVLEYKLLQYPHLVHDPQIPVDCIEAQSGIGMQHLLIDVLRRHIALRPGKQRRKGFTLIRNSHSLSGHHLDNFLWIHGFPPDHLPNIPIMHQNRMPVKQKDPAGTNEVQESLLFCYIEITVQIVQHDVRGQNSPGGIPGHVIHLECLVVLNYLEIIP